MSSSMISSSDSKSTTSGAYSPTSRSQSFSSTPTLLRLLPCLLVGRYPGSQLNFAFSKAVNCAKENSSPDDLGFISSIAAFKVSMLVAKFQSEARTLKFSATKYPSRMTSLNVSSEHTSNCCLRTVRNSRKSRSLGRSAAEHPQNTVNIFFHVSNPEKLFMYSTVRKLNCNS